MMAKMTAEERDQRVIRALVDFFRERIANEAGESDLDLIVRRSGVHVGHVQSVLEEWEVPVIEGIHIHHTGPLLNRLEAELDSPLESPEAVPNVVYNLNAGPNSQNQMGHNVSGTQSMVTYHHVLEQLRQDIEKSDMSAPDKKTALAKLAELVKSPGFIAVLNAAATGAKLLFG